MTDEKVTVRSEFCYSKHVEQSTNVMCSYVQEYWDFHLDVPKVQERKNVVIFRQYYRITQPSFGICNVPDAMQFNLLTSTFGGLW